MPRLTVEQLVPGMVLSRAVMNDSGITLIAEQSTLTEGIIKKIIEMNIHSVSIVGPSRSSSEKEQMVRALEERFRSVGDDPRMALLKKAVREHIEGL